MNVDAVRPLLDSKDWSEPTFARKLGLDYSYVFRILRGNRGIGNKFLTQLIKFCEKERISFRSFIDV